MQVYTNSKGIEFCAIGDVVIRTWNCSEVISVSGINCEQLVRAIQAGVVTFHSTLTAKQYVTLANAIKCGFIK